MAESTVKRAAIGRLAAGMLVLAAGACASSGDLEEMHLDMRRIAVRQDSVLAEQNRLIREILRETGSTQGRLNDQSNEIFDLRGELFGELREIRDAFVRFESVVGENQRGIAALRATFDDALAQLAARGTREAETTVADGATLQRDEGSPDPSELFETGLSFMQDGSLGTARMALEELLTTFPNHDLAPEAAFHLAQISHLEGDPDTALAGFRELRSRFPTAARAPHALYQMALIQLETGNRVEGIANLELIVNTYAGTDIAEVAADKLAEVGGG